MPISAKFKQAQKKVANARRKAQRPSRPTMTATIQKVLAKSTESKFVDTYIPNDLTVNITPMISNDLTGNGNVTLINPVQQGAANYNRIGNSIQIQSIRARVTFTQQYGQVASVAPTQLGNKVRFVIIWDRDGTTTSAPSFSSMFGWRDATGTLTTGLNAPLRVEENRRFRVLHDEIIDFTPPFGPSIYSDSPNVLPPPTTLYQTGYGDSSNNNSAYVIERRTKDIYIDCSKKNMKTRYTTTANPIVPSQIANGGLYLVAKCGNASPGYSHVGFSTDSYVRLRYTDS